MCEMETVKLYWRKHPVWDGDVNVQGTGERQIAEIKMGADSEGPEHFCFDMVQKQPERHQERNGSRLGNGWISSRMREVFSQE